MTIEELRTRIDKNVSENNGLIRCENVYQRTEVIQFLLEIGYELHPAAASWLKDNPEDAQYLHPGPSSNHKLTCWSNLNPKTVISFEEIAELMAQIDSPLDERSSEEFSEAFAELYS